MSETESLRAPEATRTIESRVINEIRGARLQHNLLELAKIGGVIKEIGREVAVTRLALSDTDLRARAFLAEQMEEAGMKVEHHPMGLIASYPGENPELTPVILMSHPDSVPNGGAYDGTVGIISSIEIVRILKEKGITLPRSIMVLAVTAEESSRFNIALLGSKAIFHGLTDPELDTRRSGDQSLREALTTNGFNVDDVTEPRITSERANETPLIELHVSQNDSLEQHGKDLAIIEAIAAPDRRQIIIGEPIKPDPEEPSNVQYLRVSVKGESGHSGATPMGSQYRADGLIFPTTQLLLQAIDRIQKAGNDINISVGNLAIKDQSLNKIPGEVEFTLKIGGNDVSAIENIIKDISDLTELKKVYQDYPEFKQRSVSIIRDLEKPRNEKFYRSGDIIPRQAFALNVIRAVKYSADRYQSQGENIVGTVGTYNLNGNGQIELGIDIRGTDLSVRNAVVDEIENNIRKLSKGPFTTIPIAKHGEVVDQSRVVFFYPPPGFVEISSEGPEVSYELKQLTQNSDPTLMDPQLVALVKEVIEDHKLGSYEVTFSPAGHDTQSAAREGFRTVMIFIPSRNNGASHVPEEYSTPEDLERGAKALAAAIIRLASEENGLF